MPLGTGLDCIHSRFFLRQESGLNKGKFPDLATRGSDGSLPRLLGLTALSEVWSGWTASVRTRRLGGGPELEEEERICVTEGRGLAHSPQIICPLAKHLTMSHKWLAC